MTNKNIKELPSLGGWNVYYHKIAPTDASEFKLTCPTCNTFFVTTLKTNSRVDEAKIFLHTEPVKHSFWTGEQEVVDSWQRINLLYGVCPNCGREQSLGAIPSHSGPEQSQSTICRL